MFRLITVTLAALYAVLYFVGAQDRRVEVSRQASPDDSGALTLAAFTTADIESARLPTKSFGISEREAVEIALQKGADIRDGRTAAPLYGVVAAVNNAGVEAAETAPVPSVEATQPEMWYVIGSRVNLRAGPGTGNAVVGNLGFGAEAEVLGDKDGWYEIRTVDGAASGWIFGKFLTDNRPG